MNYENLSINISMLPLMLPYSRQSIAEDDIERVGQALRSDLITTGPRVQEFEQKFAEWVGARYAVAVNSGTAALHLALLVAEIGAGDRVITSPNTFLATANSAAYVGAIPDFADIDPVTYCLSPEHLSESWLPDTRAVIAVHYAGQTADMPAIAGIARSRNGIVIEDACHAIGGQFEYQGSRYKVGGHPWADISTFSFHSVKTITTGEGGMLVTDNRQFAETARHLRSHGMYREQENFIGLGTDQPTEFGPWYYEMHQLGFNYRITDFQCALGLSQLNRMHDFTTRRRQIAQRYNTAFAANPNIVCPGLRNPADHDITSWHLYTVQVDFPAIKMTRTELMQRLRHQGIGSQVLYIPVYLQPWYRQQYGYRPGKCPQAEAFYQKALSLPLFPAMTDADVDTVIEAVTMLTKN